MALKSPPTIATGAVFAALRLQCRSVLSETKSLRYWTGLSWMWCWCSHCCSLSQSLYPHRGPMRSSWGPTALGRPGRADQRYSART